MMKQNQYFPKRVTHPGKTLKEKLEEMKMGAKEFAIRTGKPEKTISAILKGQSSITSDMAVQFENVLEIPAKFWLRYQMGYDEYVSRMKRSKVIEKAATWAKAMPYQAMAKLGWIEKQTTLEDWTETLLQFFGIATHTAWDSYYLEQRLKLQFRISLKQTTNPHAVSAWLRHGEIQADQIDAPSFDRKKFVAHLTEIKTLMANRDEGFFADLQRLCLEAGVKVVYTPCLPKAPISGSTRWLDGSPLIQLSGRYKRNDIFWFTFFHEAGHILLHGKKFVSLEAVDYEDKDADKEKEADEFAIRWTFSEKEEANFLVVHSFKHDRIRIFAKKINTHPSLIVGRLMRKKMIPHYFGQKAFFKTVDLTQ